MVRGSVTSGTVKMTRFDPQRTTGPTDAPVGANAVSRPVPFGLTSEQARDRLAKFGPNAMPDTATRPWRVAIGKFWAPVPWMLELAIMFQLVLGAYVEAAVIAVLLVFNGLL